MLTVPVAAVGHLIALNEVATPADLELARESLMLIIERGYQRDRDLVADYEKLVTK